MPEAESPPPNPAKSRAVLWLAGLGVPLLLLLAWWPSGKPKTRPALPNPNGYDYLVKAGASLGGIWTNLTHHTLTAIELQASLAANQRSLELVREGLRHTSHTHTDYNVTYIERMMTNNANFKQMARLFAGEGFLAELEGKPNIALEAYADGMRFGQECGRGGIIIERLVSVAVESHSLKELRPLVAKLGVAELRRALEQLQQLDTTHDAAHVNLASEAEWVSKIATPWERLMLAVHPAVQRGAREARESLTQKVDALQATRRRAIVEAAARLFELEKGRRPTGYADLVPAYLKAIPLDPTTGKEIVHPF